MNFALHFNINLNSKKMKNSTKLAALVFTAVLFITANVAMAQKAGGPWNTPTKYKTMKSTVKAGDASIATVGKDLYNKNCKSCHGAKGLGDGPKSASLKTLIPSFADKAFKGLPDGEMYYRSFVGRDEMPNFEKKVLDEGDRWAIVGYLKTL
jgi:mono/diheme cytochrome c family protein